MGLFPQDVISWGSRLNIELYSKTAPFTALKQTEDVITQQPNKLLSVHTRIGSICIIHGPHICKFSYMLKLTRNPRISSHGAFADMQNGENV